MTLKDKILKLASIKNEIRTSEISEKYKISRQYASRILNELVDEKKLIKFGSTRSAFYAHPQLVRQQDRVVQKRYKNIKLEEDAILEDIRRQDPFDLYLPDNLKSIYHYSFLEMMNNAIEHSKAKNIEVKISKNDRELQFEIKDSGIGAFKNIMRRRKLGSELEAVQDLLKGKTTTAPKAHSGEGIFFTSKVADVFELESFGYKMIVDNQLPDVFVEKLPRSKKGTVVRFSVALNSKRVLKAIFEHFQTDSEELAFDKTEIQIRLYTLVTSHISRSQARRVLSGLEKFNVITFDFDRVSTVGQAFADEIFRVFQNKHPHIQLLATKMNEVVEFMVQRARGKSNS